MRKPIQQLVLDRHHGHRGTLIVPHRAIRTLDLEFSRVAMTVVVGLGLTAIWILLWNRIAEGWAGLQRLVLQIAGSDAEVVVASRSLAGLVELKAPRILIGAGAPSDAQWWIGLWVWLGVLGGSWIAGRKALPLAYALRLLCLVHASALFFFRTGRSFPYDVAGYSEVLHYAGMMVVALVPLIYGLTFYPLDFSRGRKLAITLVAMAHLSIFVPLQYLLHALLIERLSLLYMPLFFWAFGLTVDVFVVITLYGWAASWEPLPYRHRSWWIPLRPIAPAMGAVIFAMLLLSCAAKAAGQELDWDYALRADASVGRYDRDFGDHDSEGLHFSASRYFHDAWHLDIGRAQRFDESAIGYGLGWRRHLRRDRSVSLGLSSGSGEVLFPRWRLDAGIEQGLLANDPLLLSLGYTHTQSHAENRSDGLQLEARWYGNTPLILSGFGRIERGHPGDTISRAAGAGLMLHRPRRISLSAGVEFGEVSYVLLLPGEAAVDFESFVWRLGANRDLNEGWNAGLRFENFQSDVYDFWSAGVEVTRRW